MRCLLYVLMFFGAGLTPAFADNFYGVIYSDHKIQQAMEDSGSVESINVKLGQSVKKGDVLITLESGIQALEQQRNRLAWKDTKELDSQQKRLDIIRNKLEVAQSLYAETRSISRDELDNLSLELIQVEGRIAQIKEQKLRDEIEYHLSTLRLQKKQLRSAIDGVVISLSAKHGEWAKIGEPIIGLVNADELNINLNVPDLVARSLTLNRPVKVEVNNLPKQTGFIDYISPVADPASGLVEVKIKLKNAQHLIRPGVKALVAF